MIFGPDQPMPLAGPMQPPTLKDGDGTLQVITRSESPDFVPMHDSNLVLTQDQENELVRYALDRMQTIKYQMGIQPDGTVMDGSWIDIRLCNEMSAANDVRWRAKRMPTSVFVDSNVTKGTSKRHCRLYAAKLRDDLLGTRPFFGAFAQDMADPDEVKLAKDAESLAQHKIGEESNVPEVAREALRLSAIRNEAVVKTSYLRDATPFIGPATVYIDDAGMPLRSPELGLLIYENDDMLPDPAVENLLRLEKDPSFAMTRGQYDVQFFPALEQTQVHYDGACSEILEPRDFLCPLEAEDIHSADLIAHLREDTPAKLNGIYGRFTTFEKYKASRPVTGRLQPREHQNEREDVARLVTLPQILIAECYLRYEINGQECEIMLVLDVEAKAAVFYDYLGNHMSRRPFTVFWGVEREALRWYGVGVFGMMQHNEEYIDTQFNRFNRADSRTGTINWVAKNAVKGMRDGQKLEIGSGKFNEIDQVWDSDKPIAGVININNMSPEQMALGQRLMDDMEQGGAIQFGILGNAEASGTDLNNSRTATGVMNNERNANVLTKDSEHDHILSVEDLLSLALEFVIENIPSQVLLLDPKTQTLASLSREEIKRLRRKVKLLLTRSKSAEALVSNQQAEAVFLRYMRLTPREQYYGRTFYLNQLRGLEVQDANGMLPEVTKQEMDAWMQAEASKSAPPEPPSESISVKYTDLARSEQVQLLARMGLKPASDAEMMQKQAQETAQEVALSDAKAKPEPKNGSTGAAKPASSPSRS